MTGKSTLLLTLALATLAGLPASAAPPSSGSRSTQTSPSEMPDARAHYAQLPLSFELNQGQTDNRVKFFSRGTGYQLFLTTNEATLVLTQPRTGREKGMGRTSAFAVGQAEGKKDELERNGVAQVGGSTTVQLTLQGAVASASVTGLDELPGKTNYFIGNDPKKWRTNVPTYAKVKYQGVYPGIDLVYYGNQSGHLEYDFVVAPGVDPKAIALSIEKKTDGPFGKHDLPLSVDANGDLVLHESAGDIRFQKPIVYQEDADGQREYRDGRYVLASEGAGVQQATISFAVGNYDHSKALIIDPAIAYSTFLGGSNPNHSTAGGSGVAAYTDPSTGHTYAYVVGTTCYSDFPTFNARQSLFGGGDVQGCGDAFITKFDPAASGSASVIYSTFLGGNGADNGTGVAVDSSGNLYVSGLTSSTNFPTMNPYQSTLRCQTNCGQNAFLTKLSADGSALLYSTYFGGSGVVDGCVSEQGVAIATDSAGRAYIAGGTFASDLPTVNPFPSTAPSDFMVAFVAAFDTTRAGSASLFYSTYLGGPSSGAGYGSRTYAAIAYAVAVDGAGTIHVAGQASSNQFPVVNGFQLTPSTGSHGGAFYSRLNPSASGSAQLLYSTYLGGSIGGSTQVIDSVYAIAVDSAGNAYLAGDDVSGAFPTTTSVNQSTPDYTFVSKINPSLAGANSLLYSTVFFTGFVTGGIGGSKGIAVDASGNAFVVGSALPGLQLVNPVSQSANGVLQTINAGQTWTMLNQGLTDFPILALAVDASTSPRTIYAGTGLGTVFATTDGGLNWNRVLQVPSTGSTTCSRFEIGILTGGPVCVMALAVDPTAPSNVYAGTSAGVYKSSDRGATWAPLNAGFSSTAVQGIEALQFDDYVPQCTAPTSATLYAGAPDGLYVLCPGATSWVPSSLTADVGHIAVDTRTVPHTILTGFDLSLGGSIVAAGYRSTDGGATWTAMNSNGPQLRGDGFVAALGVDTGPVPSTLYGIAPYTSYDIGYLFDSVNEGSTWNQVTNAPNLPASATITVDRTTTPSTVYLGNRALIYSSTNGGTSWTNILPGTLSSGGTLYAIAVDSTTTPSTVYAATAIPSSSGFVAELNPSGSAFLFSTYLGGLNSTTTVTAAALDTSDNIYVTGTTTAPLYFPAVNAFQTPTASNGQGAFFAVLGNQTLPASSSGSITSQVAVQNGTLAITLPNITGSTTSSEPTLTVTPLSSAQTANFSLSNNLGAYDISTTASFSGSVTLCFQALTVNDPMTFNNLELFHIVNGTLENVTSSLDFSTRTVCGTVPSLSPFVLFSPTTSTVLGASLNPSIFGESVTFTATAAGSGGIPTGTVTFYDGTNALGTETLNTSGQATLSVAGLAAGTHTITAVYGGNAQLHASTSVAFTETVNKGSSATVIIASATPSILNESIKITATVSAAPPASGTPTGTVTFYDGANTIGTATLNSYGQGMLTISSLAVGSHSITAVYGGDSNFKGSTSTELSQLVQYEPLGTNCLGAAGHQILQPINADGSSVWKQGRTIPAQFRVCDFNGNSVGTPGVVSSFRLTAVIAGTESNVDETVSATNGDTAFHWDATNQQWVFNIGTKSLAANNTYVYTITLNDGTVIGFQYGLK